MRDLINFIILRCPIGKNSLINSSTTNFHKKRIHSFVVFLDFNSQYCLLNLIHTSNLANTENVSRKTSALYAAHHYLITWLEERSVLSRVDASLTQILCNLVNYAFLWCDASNPTHCPHGLPHLIVSACLYTFNRSQKSPNAEPHRHSDCLVQHHRAWHQLPHGPSTYRWVQQKPPAWYFRIPWRLHVRQSMAASR